MIMESARQVDGIGPCRITSRPARAGISCLLNSFFPLRHIVIFTGNWIASFMTIDYNFD